MYALAVRFRSTRNIVLESHHIPEHRYSTGWLFRLLWLLEIKVSTFPPLYLTDGSDLTSLQYGVKKVNYLQRRAKRSNYQLRLNVHVIVRQATKSNVTRKTSYSTVCALYMDQEDLKEISFLPLEHLEQWPMISCWSKHGQNLSFDKGFLNI